MGVGVGLPPASRCPRSTLGPGPPYLGFCFGPQHPILELWALHPRPRARSTTMHPPAQGAQAPRRPRRRHGTRNPPRPPGHGDGAGAPQPGGRLWPVRTNGRDAGIMKTVHRPGPPTLAQVHHGAAAQEGGLHEAAGGHGGILFFFGGVCARGVGRRRRGEAWDGSPPPPLPSPSHTHTQTQIKRQNKGKTSPHFTSCTPGPGQAGARPGHGLLPPALGRARHPGEHVAKAVEIPIVVMY
jgi:hypothetical protein